MKAPYLCGFQKCGQNSLIEHWKNTGVENVHTTEDITSIHCIPTYLPYIDTHYPVVIIRDKVEAIWSIYWFFGYYKGYTLENFLKIDLPAIQYGNNNPINRVDFEYHCSKFKDAGIYDLIVYKLEEMSEDFPVKNTTQSQFDNSDSIEGYRAITSQEQATIRNAIRDYDRDKLEFKVKLI